MKFRDELHQTLFSMITDKMTCKDVYHKTLAYLIALDDECRNHVEAIFDFEENRIKPECLNMGWQTGTSLRTTLLAFNLFTDGTVWCPDELKERCTPSELFCSEYAVYYSEALSIRFSFDKMEKSERLFKLLEKNKGADFTVNK